MNRYDWSKLDAGWSYESDARVLRCDNDWFRIGALEDSYTPDDEYWTKGYTEARAQLAKCRIRDTERAPMYELPVNPRVEELRRVAPYMAANFEHMGRELAQQTADAIALCHGRPEPTPEELARLKELVNKPAQCTVCGMMGLRVCEDPEPIQPWLRGPLASWKLVTIFNRDDRLTVVMKRGRGELIDETGPDDETLWERLGQKASAYAR